MQINTFQSLRRSNYQRPQCSSTCAVFPLKNKQIRFSWNVLKGFIFSKRRENQIKLWLEKCIVQTISVFNFQLKKLPVSATVKKNAKPALTFWIFYLGFKGRKPTIMLFGGDGTHCFAKNEWLLRKRKTETVFEEFYPSTTIKFTQIWAKEGKNHSIYGIIVSTPHCLIQVLKKSFAIPIFTPPIWSKSTSILQSPTMLLSGLWTLDQHQFLWVWNILSRKWHWVPKKVLWQPGACCCLKDKKFWTTI